MFLLHWQREHLSLLGTCRSPLAISCCTLLRRRLRSQIVNLERQRYGFHTSPVVSTLQKSAHITAQYTDTVPPTLTQLDAAAHFFATHVPTKSWTASEWRKHISQHSSSLADIVPEIAFLGRSNSGKSSLMNALLDSPGLCRVGPRPGKTTIMHAWSLALPPDRPARGKKGSALDAEPKITVLDMPGYGHGSRTEWGQDIIKYIRRRKQLRRAFILLNPKHGIKASDEQILQVLRAEGIPHQIVACKCDDVKASELAGRLEELRGTVTRSAAEQGALGLVLSDVLAVGHLGDGKANQRVERKAMRGVDGVQWAILQATGLEQYATEKYTESLQPQKEKRPLRVIDSQVPSSRSQSTESNVSI